MRHGRFHNIHFSLLKGTTKWKNITINTKTLGIFDPGPNMSPFLPCCKKENTQTFQSTLIKRFPHQPTYIYYTTHECLFEKFFMLVVTQILSTDWIDSKRKHQINLHIAHKGWFPFNKKSFFMNPRILPFKRIRMNEKKTRTKNIHANKEDKWLRNLFFKSTNMEKCTQSESTYKMGANGTIVKIVWRNNSIRSYNILLSIRNAFYHKNRIFMCIFSYICFQRIFAFGLLIKSEKNFTQYK